MPKIEQGLTVVGVTCGIGSMLVGARQAGFDVVGNIEWRKYYHKKDPDGMSTFLANFPGAFMVEKVEDLPTDDLARATGCDLAIGHPECGLYSKMQGCNNFRKGRNQDAKDALEKQKDPGDIPLFLDLIRQLRPRFFVMDDLPKSFLACPMEEYHRRLPDYDLFPEWISNYHYGNIQKSRVRMFMIGALKSEAFTFRPGEVDHDRTISDVIGDLPTWPESGDFPNHDPHTEKEAAGRALHMDYPWHRPTYGDLKKWFEGVREGVGFSYHSPHGGVKKKPGWYKQRWASHCHVLDGGSGHIHPLRNLPFSVRERARIQGFPDDFIFYGTNLNDDGEWNHERNIHMVKQTGKAMPVQFCRYVSDQIAHHIEGRKFRTSGERFARADSYVNGSKQWFCQEVGYADQEGACEACWLRGQCRIRIDKYGFPPVAGPKVIQLGIKRVTNATEDEPVKRSPKPPPSPKPARPARVVQQIDTKVVVIESPKGTPKAVDVPKVNVVKGETPDDYHCDCRFCKVVIGNLIQKDGTHYTRLERRKYYDPREMGGEGHVAKTPLHIARWAVQAYTKPGDWVLDPTAGAGTTIVESLIQGRRAAGMELQFHDIIESNVRLHAVGPGRKAVIGFGDARNIEDFMKTAKIPRPTLIVNNPPYSGDEHQTTFNIKEERKKAGDRSTTFYYDQELPNLAFLREGDEYWSTMYSIYKASAEVLLTGGHMVIGVKDMMRNKQSFMLHRFLCEVIEKIDSMQFVGTAFLKHHPGTLFLHTYEKMHGVRPPLYQTISVFRKKT